MQRAALQHATDGIEPCNGRRCNMQRATLQHAEKTRRNKNQHATVSIAPYGNDKILKFQMQQTAR
jgi:hypothetical protein